MRFGELMFDKTGCCGTHTYSEVVHANGVISQVYDNKNGTYSVVTMAAGMLLRGSETYDSPPGVERRLSEDASI